MMSAPLSRLLVFAALIALPIGVYWNTIFHSYGFRDDYSMMREAREEPGKIMGFCSSHARPIYGLLLEHSFALVRTVEDLRWLRLLAAGLFGLVAAATFRTLRLLTWPAVPAAAIAALIPLLPGAQVMVSWAVTWPFPVGLLLAILGFVCTERALLGKGAAPRPLPWVLGVMLFALSAMIYQSSPLFQVVLVAAGFLRRRDRPANETMAWVVRHLATLGVGMALAFTAAFVGFALEWLPVSERIAIESNWGGKVAAFFAGPLPNALALIVLNRTDQVAWASLLAACVVAVLLGAGAIRERRVHGSWAAVRWLGTLGLCLVASYSVLLLVAENAGAYRTLLPLTGVVTVFLASVWRELFGRRAGRILLVGLAVVAAGLARQQAYGLLAWPQGLEWRLIREGAERIQPEETPWVFIQWPREIDTPARLVYGDEFGSFSSTSVWAPLEMLKAAVRERFPEEEEVARLYFSDTGNRPAAGREYNVTIDLRKLREFRVEE